MAGSFQVAGFSTSYRMPQALKYPIVLSETFIEATRDTGYRSTAAAVAELVDNSIQAEARHVHIFVNDGPDGISVSVLDDGTGMDAATLRLALQFGGSKRFADRSGLGRFGMGLPNASVSQARRVEVVTWRAPTACIESHLDVDDIADGSVNEVPTVRRATFPKWAEKWRRYSGTLVTWQKCDRIDNRRVSTVARKLHEPLGRIFRNFIWGGVKIAVNGEAVVGIDPLFLHKATPLCGAATVGDPLTFEVQVPGQPGKTSLVRVRFSELPIDKWHDMPVEEKRRHGIVDGAGLSILRAGREVDYGWWFFGSKRRENYDSWWRGELAFEPDLDELFAITHSKQGINPVQELREILTPDLEAVARQLNGRVQRAFGALKGAPETAATVKLPVKSELAGKSAVARNGGAEGTNSGRPAVKAKEQEYQVALKSLGGKDFFTATSTRGKWTITINRDHPFYAVIYQRAGNREHLEQLLLALAKVGVGKKLMAACGAELKSLLRTKE